MTRVFPLPAPARISTGPSVVSTASRCWGLSWSKKDNGPDASSKLRISIVDFGWQIGDYGRTANSSLQQSRLHIIRLEEAGFLKLARVRPFRLTLGAGA